MLTTVWCQAPARHVPIDRSILSFPLPTHRFLATFSKKKQVNKIHKVAKEKVFNWILKDCTAIAGRDLFSLSSCSKCIIESVTLTVLFEALSLNKTKEKRKIQSSSSSSSFFLWCYQDVTFFGSFPPSAHQPTRYIRVYMFIHTYNITTGE